MENKFSQNSGILGRDPTIPSPQFSNCYTVRAIENRHAKEAYTCQIPINRNDETFKSTLPYSALFLPREMFIPSLSFIVSSRNRWLYTTRHGSNKISTARGLALEFSTIHRLSIGTRTPRLSRYDRQEPEKLHRIPAERRGKLKNVDETKPVETIFSSRIRGRLSNEGEERKKKAMQWRRNKLLVAIDEDY